MHNLAISLAKQGHQVTGSDDQIVEPSRSHLIEAGLLPDQLGWFEERVTDDIDAVILGAHAQADNPELKKAQDLALKIYSFPEFVQELSQDKIRVVIAGSYGKTTIASMVMHVMRYLGKEFDYLVGAQLRGFDRLVDITKHNKVIIIEGDEYVSSKIDPKSKFLYYKPNIALISGIVWNEYNSKLSKEDYIQQFEDFIDTIPSKGTLIYNKEDAVLQKVLQDTKDCKINRHGYKFRSIQSIRELPISIHLKETCRYRYLESTIYPILQVLILFANGWASRRKIFLRPSKASIHLSAIWSL